MYVVDTGNPWLVIDEVDQVSDGTQISSLNTTHVHTADWTVILVFISCAVKKRNVYCQVFSQACLGLGRPKIFSIPFSSFLASTLLPCMYFQWLQFTYLYIGVCVSGLVLVV